ncbi:hypothetical protein ABZZ47_31500 [Streptomyces sp. NPDC006465]|uniref:hypothetical protein n=1 Tax=Streptomyces sp. NPDC006465 TaxID=3157174 RepID=UPI0033A12F98
MNTWFRDHKVRSVLLAVALLADVVIFGGFAAIDLDRADEITESISVFFRFGLFILNSVALVGVLTGAFSETDSQVATSDSASVSETDEKENLRRNWRWLFILIAQAASIPFLAFPIALEIGTIVHDGPDWIIVIVAGVLLSVALAIVFFILVNSPLHLTGTWGVIIALFPLLGLAQFWYQAYYQPTHDRPRVDVAVKIDQVRTVRGVTSLRGSIVVTNNGAASIDVLGSIYKVVGYRMSSGIDSVRAAIDLVPPDQRHKGADESLLEMDDVLPAGASLTPGQRWSKDFVFDADGRKNDFVRLTADLALITHAPGGVEGVGDCKKEGYQVCAKTKFDSPTRLRKQLGDEPFAISYVLFKSPKDGKMQNSPYLYIDYGVVDRRQTDERVIKVASLLRDVMTEAQTEYRLDP